MTIYKISVINGKFDHVRGKVTAVAQAREMVGAQPQVTEDDLRKFWGVRIERVPMSVARSIGLGAYDR